MSIVICFPHTSASHEIGSKALANCYDILLCMPYEIDSQWGDPILTDLQVLAATSGRNTVEKTQSVDFSDPDIKVIFFPSLGE